MFCQKCGREIPDDAAICPYCGLSINEKSEGRKNKKSKWWIIPIVIVAVAAILCVIIVTIVSNIDKNTFTASQDNTTQTTQKSEQEANGSAIVGGDSKSSSSNIGNYNVKYKSAFVTTNHSGKQILVVTYDYSNNSDKNGSFTWTISDKAFQSGVELGEVYSDYSIKGYSDEASDREIQPGKSLVVQRAYELNDTTTQVEIQLDEYMSFDNEICDTVKIDLK